MNTKVKFSDKPEGAIFTSRAFRVLSATRKKIIQALSELTLLQDVCRVMVDEGGFQLACVHYLQKDAHSTMKLVAKAGNDDKYLENITVTWSGTKYGRGLIGTTVRTGWPQVTKNFQTDPRLKPWRDQASLRDLCSAVSLPLKDQTGVFATFTVFANEINAFHDTEMCLLGVLVDDLNFGIGSLLAQRFADEHKALKDGSYKIEVEPMERLSRREREVLKQVAQGLSSKEIAFNLNISSASVDTYRSRIMFKLGIEGIAGIVRFAIKHGVIAP